MAQEKHLQGNFDPNKLWTAETVTATGLKMARCANVTQRKRLRLQGDQLEIRTSPRKEMPEGAREDLERERVTQRLIVKGKEVE
jgi:hypothetical protein